MHDEVNTDAYINHKLKWWTMYEKGCYSYVDLPIWI